MNNIFKNTLRSFRSDITGEEKEYKVNNAVWIYMDSLFDMNQTKFDKELEENENVALAKFTTAILKANDLDVTYEEVMANTDPKSVIKFYDNFFNIAFQVESRKKPQKAVTKNKNQ